jgi:hypothetical protein
MTSSLSLFDQIKTEPIQFYPQNFANAQQQAGTLLLQPSNVLAEKPMNVRKVINWFYI